MALKRSIVAPPADEKKYFNCLFWGHKKWLKHTRRKRNRVEEMERQ